MDEAPDSSNPTIPKLTPKEISAAPQLVEGVGIPETIEELMQHEGLAFVQAAYLLFLQRPADHEGLIGHYDLLRSGASKNHVAYELARSAEAHARYTSGLPLAKEVFQRKLAELVSEITEDTDLYRVLHFAREQLLWSLPQTSIEPESSASTHVRTVSSPDLPLRPGTPPAPDGVWKERGTIWMDLTTSFEWKGGVVGIVRAELEVASGMHRIDPSIRFSMQVDSGFAEIDPAELKWLLNAENVVDAYMGFFGRYKGQAKNARSITVKTPQTDEFFYPYSRGDMVLAMGWMDSNKERMFTKLKDERSDIYVCYLVYDTILLGDTTRHFYDPVGRARFHDYMKWVCHHCDFLLFGGETAKRDTETLQALEDWNSPVGQAVKFGTDIMKSVDPDQEQALLDQIGITGPFIMTVGSLEPRKNHETLYRAYLLALEMDPDNLPQLIVCGKPMWRVDDLLDSMDRDPRLKNHVIRLAPTDAELAALYKNCRFTLLPSIYEGWSLTLPESLGQGKFCLSCETPPLREIGGELIDYAEPFDVRGWAEKIILYARDDVLLAAKEERIAAEWPTTRWLDTAQMVHDALISYGASHQPQPAVLVPEERPDLSQDPTIWMDLTLTYLHQRNASLSGIVRAELTYAYYLKKLDPKTRFFAHENGYNGYYFEIPQENLNWLFEAVDLTKAYGAFHALWQPREAAGTDWRDPIRPSWPWVAGDSLIQEFPANSIIFFAGIDSDGTGALHRTKNLSRVVSPHKAILSSQLLYDFTPILMPQVHTKDTVTGYKPFVEQVSNHFDHLVYGGRTAQKDGIRVQEQNGYRSPPSDFIEFGADLALSSHTAKQRSEAGSQEILKGLGITGPFVMTVGTIEPRKNHEMLYKAYLHLLERNKLDEPLQLVIVGRPGWKSGDFLDTLKADQRVKNLIVVLTPTDDELDALYTQCKFTLLPSFYEGWSLTLPESFRYGKFCLVSDVEPLRETGRNLVEYIHPLDTYRWAERIEHYANHPSEVKARESAIKNSWHVKTWMESADNLRNILLSAHKQKFNPLGDGKVPTAKRAERQKAS